MKKRKLDLAGFLTQSKKIVLNVVSSFLQHIEDIIVETVEISFVRVREGKKKRKKEFKNF